MSIKHFLATRRENVAAREAATTANAADRLVRRDAGPAKWTAGPPAVKVKTYDDAKAYGRDAPKMAAAGWSPQGNTQGGDKINVGRTALKCTMPVTLLLSGRSKRSGKITVTWTRP